MIKTLTILGKLVTVEYGIYSAGEITVTVAKRYETVKRPYTVHINGTKTPVVRVGVREVFGGLKGRISACIEYNGRSYASEKKLAEAIIMDSPEIAATIN